MNIFLFKSQSLAGTVLKAIALDGWVLKKTSSFSSCSCCFWMCANDHRFGNDILIELSNKHKFEYINISTLIIHMNIFSNEDCVLEGSPKNKQFSNVKRSI